MFDGKVLRLHLECPSQDQGWIVIYDGLRPHITTINGPSPGTKVLVQVIGAPRLTMKHPEGTRCAQSHATRVLIWLCRCPEETRHSLALRRGLHLDRPIVSLAEALSGGVFITQNVWILKT